MKIERFEDIRAWQGARVLTNMVYDASDRGPFAKDFGLRDQIRRAAGSTMHNISEGFDAGSDAEFIRFLKYARRSASEVQSQLYVALDRRYITQEQFQRLYDQATSVKKLINAFIGYLNKPHQQASR
jgi:four helix bundle protein